MLLALDRLFKVVVISGVTTVALVLLQNLTLPGNTPSAIKSHEGAFKLLTAVGLGVVVAGGDKKQTQIDVINELKKKLVTASPSEAVVISTEIRLLETKLGITEEVQDVQSTSKEDRNKSSVSSSIAQPLDALNVQSEPNGRLISANTNTLTELTELVTFYEQSKN